MSKDATQDVDDPPVDDPAGADPEAGEGDAVAAQAEDGAPEEIDAAADSESESDAEPDAEPGGDDVPDDAVVAAGDDDAAGEDAAAEEPDAALAESGEAGVEAEAGDETDIDEDEAVIVLDTRASLAAARDLAPRLAGMSEDIPLVLDAGGVEEMSTPYVLALIGAIRARDGAAPVAALRPSPAFVDAFSDLGLFEDLMKMEFRQ